MTTVKKIFDLLTPRERRNASLLFGMVLLMAFFDMGGIAALMAAMANLEGIQTNSYLFAAYNFFNFQSTPTFLYALSWAVLVLIIYTTFKAFTPYILFRFTKVRSHSIARRLIQRYLSQSYDWLLNRHSAGLENQYAEALRIIAPRFSTVEECDKIFIIQFGSIAAEGPTKNWLSAPRDSGR